MKVEMANLECCFLNFFSRFNETIGIGEGQNYNTEFLKYTCCTVPLTMYLLMFLCSMPGT